MQQQQQQPPRRHLASGTPPKLQCTTDTHSSGAPSLPPSFTRTLDCRDLGLVKHCAAGVGGQLALVRRKRQLVRLLLQVLVVVGPGDDGAAALGGGRRGGGRLGRLVVVADGGKGVGRLALLVEKEAQELDPLGAAQHACERHRAAGARERVRWATNPVLSPEWSSSAPCPAAAPAQGVLCPRPWPRRPRPPHPGRWPR